jgi:hypothetical protein
MPRPAKRYERPEKGTKRERDEQGTCVRLVREQEQAQELPMLQTARAW